MVEFVAIVGLIIVARRLRRAVRTQETIRLEIHHYVHFPGNGGGESLPEPTGDNIVPFTPRTSAPGSPSDAIVRAFRRPSAPSQ